MFAHLMDRSRQILSLTYEYVGSLAALLIVLHVALGVGNSLADPLRIATEFLGLDIQDAIASVEAWFGDSIRREALTWLGAIGAIGLAWVYFEKFSRHENRRHNVFRRERADANMRQRANHRSIVQRSFGAKVGAEDYAPVKLSEDGLRRLHLYRVLFARQRARIAAGHWIFAWIYFQTGGRRNFLTLVVYGCLVLGSSLIATYIVVDDQHDSSHWEKMLSSLFDSGLFFRDLAATLLVPFVQLLDFLNGENVDVADAGRNEEGG